MTKQTPRSQPKWTDVKAKLSSLDRLGLLALIHDLYALHRDNQNFLHTRFGVGDDALGTYKKTLERWLRPDVLRNQDVSVLKAKQAISGYQKALGDSSGLAELMVFYCECAAGFSNDVGMTDESYLDALIRMFARALEVTDHLPAADRDALMARLDGVRTSSHDFGCGVGDAMDDLIAEHTDS